MPIADPLLKNGVQDNLDRFWFRSKDDPCYTKLLQERQHCSRGTTEHLNLAEAEILKKEEKEEEQSLKLALGQP